MPLFSRSGFDIDLRSAEAVIRDNVGVDPRPWFRLPFGAGWDDERLLHRIGLLGYRHVGWHVDVQEWRPEATAEEVEEAIVTGTRAAGDGAVVLLHTWPRLTLSVEAVIRRLRDEGARFVRLDELPEAPEGLPFEADEASRAEETRAEGQPPTRLGARLPVGPAEP
jgi:peptidoglycan/xylan/chitin deacetylase (PgdA/CDA1 family)